MALVPGTYRVPLSRTISQDKAPVAGRSKSFLNFTDYDDTTIKKLHEEQRTFVKLGEEYRTERLERGQKAEDLRNGKIWNEQDEAFFASLDMSAYEINIQRPLFNTISDAWRQQQMRFRVAPKDVHAHHRYVSGKDDFVGEFAKDFGSPEAAAEYFDENVDDEFGIMLSALMMDSRQTSDGEDAENEAFDDGAFSGCSVMKATYSTKYDRNIGISIDSFSQNSLIYDEARSKNYEVDDISFIGQIHEYYPEDLIEEYPGYAEDIEATYRHLIENRRTFQHGDKTFTRWRDWYEFVDGHDAKNLKLKVSELYTRHTEPKIRVIDKQTNKIHVAKFGIEFDQIVDRLMKFMLEEAYEQITSTEGFTPDDLYGFADPQLKEIFAQQIDQRYEFEEIYEPRWYKTVSAFNAVFEHTPSPYPHNSHPYALYFSQYSHGFFRGMAEDLVDIVIAYNKAIAFQELMMAHGAKNVLLVDEDMLAENDLKKEDLADQWTRIGPVIALKLRPGVRMQDVALPVNTVGDGLDRLDHVINRYERLLNQISGIVPEQLGHSSPDSPTSRYNLQLQQGLGNNGLIFKNFFRTLKILYRKVLMMEVELLKVRKNRVVKLLGDEYRFYFDSNFLSVEWNDEFAVFEETLNTGQFGLELIPIEDNPQMGAAREGIMFELAGQGQIPIELAFKYSSWDKRHRFVKDLKQSQRDQYLQELERQVDINQLAEIMLTSGVGAEVADKVLKGVRLANVQQMNQSGQGSPQGQGNNGRIRELATQMGQVQRQQNAQAIGPDRRTQQQPQL
jgi:hypothetical protein